MDEGRIFEGAKFAAFKRLVVLHEIDKKDENKCTLFNRKCPFWACENYCTDGSSAYAFAICNKFRSDRMIIERPNNEK